VLSLFEIKCPRAPFFFFFFLSTPERSSRPVRVQDWRVTFNGKGDPVAFLERIEELCDSDGVDADQLLPHLPGLLQGEAAAWFRNNRQRWCDWKGFVTDFRLFYFPVNYQEDLEVVISRRLQRPTEPVTTYLTELQTLLRRHGNLQPEQQLSWMYRNLLPEYRLHLKRSGLTDAATLLRSVRELEALLREQTLPTGRADKHTAPQMCRPAAQPSGQPHQREPPRRRRSPSTWEGNQCSRRRSRRITASFPKNPTIDPTSPSRYEVSRIPP
jgi:hypothetical protein